MAKCSYCGRRKGKRACPALGEVCSACCGKHRAREIECPHDCAFLPGVGAAKRGLDKALAGLTKYLNDSLSAWSQPALAAFLDVGREVGDWEAAFLYGYLTLGYTDPAGQRAIDLFLEREAHTLTSDVRAALVCLRDEAFVSLFEVLEVRVDEGLRLADLAAGGELFVHERLATHQARVGDHVLAWVLRLGARYQLTGSVETVPLDHVELVREAIDAALSPSDATVLPPAQEALRAVIPGVQRLLREARRTWRVATVLTPDGEPFADCHADYAIRDSQAVTTRLQEHPDVHGDDDGFVWIASAPGQDEAEPQAGFELRTVRLTVSADSEPALARAKEFLATLLGGLIEHRADRIDTQEETFLEATRAGEGGRRRLPGPPPLGSAATRSSEDPSPSLAPWLHALPDPTDEASAPPPRPERSPDEEGRHRLPLLPHEHMLLLVPELGPAVRAAARELRQTAGWEARTLPGDDIPEVPVLEALLEEFTRSVRDAPYSLEWKKSELSCFLSHLHYFTNYELHRRKTFWVDESLAWMLSQTRLDIRGDCLRLPFPALALVFTDPLTLALAESLTGVQRENPTIREARLEALTVYVVGSEADEGGGRQLSFYFLLGVKDQSDWPYLVNRELFVRDDADLEALLESRPEDVLARPQDPFFRAPELKKLLHVAINALLYSTSAHLAPVVLPPPPRPSRRRGKSRAGRQAARQAFGSGEEVFHLAGKVGVGRIRQLAALQAQEEGANLVSRFMVRGHWRRPAANWQEQRLRWIEPYWKGPDLASVIERQYRLRP